MGKENIFIYTSSRTSTQYIVKMIRKKGNLLSKGISKKEIREFYKNKAGIDITENLKRNCAKCRFFNAISKYCGEHKIKVMTNESCNEFKTQRAHKIYSGGSVSPK